MNRVRTEDEEHDDAGETGTGRDMALGAAFAGARAGAAATRVVLAPVRLAARAPIVSSVLQRAGARLSSESQAARRQIETTATELLEAPELERTVDRVLAGPLPDSVAHSIGEHRVAERVAAGVLTTADLEAAVAAALDNERTQRIVEQVVDSAGLERIVVQVLESHLTVEVTERVLRSPEIQKLIERVAASPEIRAALTHQTSSLAGEVVGGVRHRLERLDDAAERTIHRWLHRSPAASTGTDAYGGLLTRAVAFGIDIAIAGLITFVTIGLLSLVGALVGDDPSERSVAIFTAAGWQLAVDLYLVFFWTVLGQTPAMRLMRLRVTDARGNPPSLGRSVLRLFGLLLAIVPMFAGFLPVLFSRRRKGLQDFIANTTVETTEDRKPA